MSHVFLDELQEPDDGKMVVVEHRPGFLSVFLRHDAHEDVRARCRWFAADGGRHTPFSWAQLMYDGPGGSAVRVWVLGGPSAIKRFGQAESCTPR